MRDNSNATRLPMVHQMLMYDVTMSPPISASILKMGRIPAMTRPAQISPTMAQLARALYMLKCIASPQAAINHKICNTQTLQNTKGDSVFGPAPTQNCIKLQHLQARNQCEKLAPPINLPVVTDEKLECQESQLLGTAVILLSKPGTCQRSSSAQHLVQRDGAKAPLMYIRQGTHRGVRLLDI